MEPKQTSPWGARIKAATVIFFIALWITLYIVTAGFYTIPFVRALECLLISGFASLFFYFIATVIAFKLSPAYEKETEEKNHDSAVNSFLASQQPDGCIYESYPNNKNSLIGIIIGIFSLIILGVFMIGWIYFAAQGTIIGRGGESTVNSIPERILLIALIIILPLIATVPGMLKNKHQRTFMVTGEYFKLYPDHFLLLPQMRSVLFQDIAVLTTNLQLNGRAPSTMIITLLLNDGTQKSFYCIGRNRFTVATPDHTVNNIPDLLQYLGFTQTSDDFLEKKWSYTKTTY